MKKKQQKSDHLSVACHHILKALNNGKKIKIYEVMPKTFTCLKCSKKEPQTEKQFMYMFVTICDCCIDSLR